MVSLRLDIAGTLPAGPMTTHGACHVDVAAKATPHQAVAMRCPSRGCIAFAHSARSPCNPHAYRRPVSYRNFDPRPTAATAAETYSGALNAKDGRIEMNATRKTLA